MKKWAIIPLLFAAIGYQSCLEETPIAEQQQYLQRGDSIATATFDTLRNSLLQAMETKGIAGAVRFCNVQALPITSSLAKDGITIQRVAERFRNPANALDSADSKQWQLFAQLKARGDSLTSVVQETETAFVFYKPIIMNPLCGNCHGNKAMGMQPEVLAVIDSLYPKDKALGFVKGDIRGLWKITFPKPFTD
ncbi:Tll0287-like domain-containing protein [Phnomibacter ginsenosidimutans]|uniref:DUF3365 domain-containing protein n=1 Tax=Phnomibacter ginsenosidimutans TaxID=2676868 RepID=A0A6I6GC63_9BACT|nr:DUF3365 domain-containing protein [Phnomibacter ginsenosidimutans]QGW29323.1 DUF3365 domain-containing protein [Phnomibacter ginsenosidimutans]